MFALDGCLRSAGSFAMRMAAIIATISPTLAETDPLPSWTEGATKAAIVDFVERVTVSGSPDFVPIAERIAVFDYDGTLSVEQPIPAQVAFELACIDIVSPDHPEWNSIQPFKAAIENDTAYIAHAGEVGFAEILKATHAGWSTDDYETTVSGWLATTHHDRFRQTYLKLPYQPMLELLAYLRDKSFTTFILSGNSSEFMRPWVEEVYGVAPDRVIGSSIRTKLEIEKDQETLTRLPEIDLVDDKAGRPTGIYEHIGRRPIAVFGNSDGDYEMLQWATIGRGARLGVVLHHTDAEREYAYDRNAEFGRLDKVLDAAVANKWTVIDMKIDWKTIFPTDLR